MIAEELGIELDPAVDDDRKGEVPGDESAATCAHLHALFLGHGHDCRHGFHKGFGVTDGSQQSGSARLYGFTRTGRFCRDDRQTCRGGFEDADRQAFPARGKDEGICVGKQGVDVTLEAGEMDAMLQVQFGCEAAKRFLFGADPGNA